MRKHIILFFSALLFLFACEQDSKGILSQDVMTRLLTDVHIVDGSLTSEPNADSLFKYGTGKYLFLFKQYHTDSAQFKRSLLYYSRHADVMLAMYNDINKVIQDRSDSLNKIITKDAQIAAKHQEEAFKKAEKLRTDSLAKKAKLEKQQLKKDSVDKKNGIIKPKKKKSNKKKKKVTIEPNQLNALP